MYCPHCGREMRLIDGVFACNAGGMMLSQNLHRILIERFLEHRSCPFGVEVGKQLCRWFCPGCGVPLQRGMICGQCSRSIHDLLWDLVELHPHTDG